MSNPLLLSPTDFRQEQLSPEQIQSSLKSLDEFLSSTAAKVYSHEKQAAILDLTRNVTDMIPSSIEAFFGREQMIGKLSSLINELDALSDLRASLQQTQQNQIEKHKK